MAVNIHLQHRFSNITMQKSLHAKILIARPHLQAWPVRRSRMCVYSVVSDSVRPRGLWPARLLCPGDFLGKNMLEEVVISFSRGSSRPRDRTQHLLCLLHWQAGSLPLSHPGGPSGPGRTQESAFSEAPWEIQGQEDFKLKCEK